MKWTKNEKNLTEKVEEDFAPHFVQECVSHAKGPDEKKHSRYQCISTYGKFASIPVHWVSKLPQQSKCGNHILSPVVVVEVHDDDNATIMHTNRYVLHSFTHHILQNNNVTRDLFPERAICSVRYRQIALEVVLSFTLMSLPFQISETRYIHLEYHLVGFFCVIHQINLVELLLQQKFHSRRR